jgi:hypothetical protein
MFSNFNNQSPENDQHILSILDDICSRDTHKVWSSSCQIIEDGQDREKILPLIKHLSRIKERTCGLKMGGLIASNQRFVDFAIRTIEFHRDSTACPCCLYLENGADPKKEAGLKRIQIKDTVTMEGGWVDYYVADCTRCGGLFHIIEREYHFTWWEWKRA